MGLWNFMKTAGRKLVGKDDLPTAAILEKEVSDLGLDTKGAEIKVEGDKVVVSGGDMIQEEREKVILAVGNVEGVSAVEADTPDEPVFHEVVKGDTLWAIAENTLGNGSKYNAIFEANRPMLSHPDKIYPGQVLRIPAKA